MKYFIYARKSTDTEEKQVLSIEAQLAELKEFAAKEKLEIVASLCEAKTAKEPGRTVFGEMLGRIEKGEAEGVLAWHPDRLARNSVDGGRIIYLLDTGAIKDLKFPIFWFESSPQGKFMLNIAFGQSKYYVDNLSENVKRGYRQKIRKGLWPAGRAPIGYLNNIKTKGIDIDHERASLIKKAFESYATGEYTLKGIRDLLKNMGFKSFKGNTYATSCVQKILKNPIYYGAIRFNAEISEGVHEPIISKQLFDQAQAVMANRGKKKRKRKHEYPFVGLMKCGACDGAITAERQKGHIYYRCTKKKGPCSEKYLREETLIDQLKAIIQKVALPDDWTDKMLAKLDTERAEIDNDHQAVVQNLLAEKKQIKAKLDQLLDLHLEGGVDSGEYREKKNQLVNKNIEINQKIRDFEQHGNNWLEPMRTMINSSCQAKNLAPANNPNDIYTFLKKIGSNFILKDKKFQFEGKIGWRALLKNAPFNNWLPFQ